MLSSQNFIDGWLMKKTKTYRTSILSPGVVCVRFASGENALHTQPQTALLYEASFPKILKVVPKDGINETLMFVSLIALRITSVIH